MGWSKQIFPQHTMSLAYAILGFLQQAERTGYDLKTDCFDRCMAYLWAADQAQIYKTLDKLVAQGWISCKVEIQHDRPNRKIYSVTATGKAEFTKWLECHQSLPTVREPLLVQLFFAAQLPNTAIAQLLDEQLLARQEKLVKCQEINLPILNPSREQVLQRLVIDLAIQREQAYIDWLKTAIDTISQQPEQFRNADERR